MMGRLLRSFGMLIAIGFGVAGVLAGTTALVVAVIPLAALAGFLVVAHQAASSSTPLTQPGAWTRAGCTTVAAAAASYVAIGIAIILGGATLALVVLTTATVLGWQALHRRHVSREVSRDVGASRAAPNPTTGGRFPGPPSPPVKTPRDPNSALLAAVSTAQLCLAWRGSYLAVATARDSVVLQQLSGTRQTYLDELERRNPAGFRRWINDGARAAGNPAP